MELSTLLNILDIFTRGIFIPLIWIFITAPFWGEMQKDFRRFKMFFNKKRKRKAKRKTVGAYSRPKVTYSNSLKPNILNS